MNQTKSADVVRLAVFAGYPKRYPDGTPMSRRIAITLFLVAGAIALLMCDPRMDHTASPETRAPSKFLEVIQRDGAVSFRSWNGKPLRTDSDTEFAFFAGGRVEMLEFGYGLSRYAGNYEIRENGQIVIRLVDFRDEWPEMKLESEGTTLLLRPVDPDVLFVMGNRGGAVVPGDEGSYWPFREVVGSDKKEMLDTLEDLRSQPH